MAAKFLIPLKLEDLCAYDSERYVVETDYNEREVASLLPGCNDHLSEDGPEFILKDFDVFYGVLKNFNVLDPKIRDRAWRCINKAAEQLLNQIRDQLNETQNEEENNTKNRQCNVLKMILFIFCSMIELFEDKAQKGSGVAPEAAGKGKGKKPKKPEESHEWDKNKERSIDTLLQITELSLHRLFSPPVVEEELVTLVNRCCYKIIENPLTSKKDQLKTNLFHIVGNSVARHKQALNFCMKIIQLLQSKENMMTVCSQLVTTVVKTFKQRVVITEIIREVERVDMNRDSSGTKSIAKFLEELPDKCAAEMMPSMNILIQHLDQDAYMMRSCVLVIIGKIVSECLSDENVDAKGRQFRDQLLDSLEDHILDVTTFTRSKAIQVWTKLCEEGIIPLTRLESLMEAIVGRLKDKSVYVRKSAVLFLTAFLNKNPFAAKIPLETLRNSYNKENEKLAKLMADYRGQSTGADARPNTDCEAGCQDQDFESTESDEEIWTILQPKLIDYWMEISSTSGSGEDDEEDLKNCTLLSECNDVEQVFARFRELLIDKKFKNAFRMMKLVKDQWPTHEIFADQEDNSDSSDDESSKANSEMDQGGPVIPEAVKVCKKMFFVKKQAEEVLSLDNRAVARNIEKVASNLVRSSQDTTISDVLEEAADTIHNDINKQQILVKYLKDCVKFAEQIQIAIPLVCSLLYSSSVTDSQEAIDFFVAAYQFGVQGAIIGIRRMIVLIFSRDKVVKDAVLDAYKQVYLNNALSLEMSYRNKEISVVNSLIELVRGATLGELISFEELLKNLFDSGDLGKEHTKILFEKYSQKIPGTTEEDSCAAVQLIAMLATSNEQIIRGNIDTFITVGLGERADNDSQLVLHTCYALQKATRDKPKIEEAEKSYRFEHTHDLFVRLHEVLVSGICKQDDPHWLPMCDEVVKVIYRLSEHPEIVCENILRDLIAKILPAIKTDETKEPSEQDVTDDENSLAENPQGSQRTDKSSDPAKPDVDGKRVISSEIMTRFITFIGNVAFNQLVHMESSIAAEIKIRKLLKESNDTTAHSKLKVAAKTPKTGKKKHLVPPTPGTPGESLEEEMGLAGAAAVEDVEADAIAHMCNEEMVEKFGRRGENVNLLASLSELVVTIASDQTKYRDVKLRAAATLTLAKYMCMSEKFCIKHLRLLVTILEKSDEGLIRQNAIIALGDLCVRFPNHLDPYNSHLYSPLSDPDVLVRTNALKVLTRLILSDMIKVKGQIAEIAKIVVDDKEDLQSYARFFFKELAKRENAIYNVLPDIISQLSSGDKPVEEKPFRDIMKFLFELVEKDRQTVCLVEKLCQRFRATLEERHHRDLAYCLNLLTYTEKSIGKLYENMLCFADKLTCDTVHEHIMFIITGARKLANIKNETKQMLDEFEQKVEACRSKGLQAGGAEDESELREVVGTPTAPHRRSSERAGGPVSVSKATAKPHTSKQKQASKSKPTRKVRSRRDEDSDDEDGDDFPASERTAVSRGTERPARERKKRVLHLFNEESSDED